jgi:uncharacterized protein (DUF4415 family)
MADTSAPSPLWGGPGWGTAGMSTSRRIGIRAAAALPDDQINLSDPDAPLVTVVRRRAWPVLQPLKRLKSFRIDADVLDYFESQGKGYQATVNRVLREAMLRGTRGTPGTSSISAPDKRPLKRGQPINISPRTDERPR